MTRLEEMERKVKKVKRFVITSIVFLVVGALMFMCTSIHMYITGTAKLWLLAVGVLWMMVTLALSQIAWECFEEWSSKSTEVVKLIIQNYWGLSKEDYVKIFWNFEANSEKVISKERFLAKSGAEFFAKLVTDDAVQIIATDKYGTMLNEPKVTTLSYLEEHYKKMP